jgi:hypothetical protein
MRKPRYEGDQEVTIPESILFDAANGNGNSVPVFPLRARIARGQIVCVKLEFVHTRRLAAFLLGIWLGGGLLMILIQAENLRFTSSLLSTPSDQATAYLKKSGSQQDFALMMRYQAAEQNRRYADIWEDGQFGLGLVLAASLFLGTQRRTFPLVICALMLVMLMFEHFGITPELAFRGRETDFPPGNAALGLLVRMYALGQIYAWVEGCKMVLGVLLAGYLFIFRARRTRKQIDSIDQRHASHIGG